RSGEELWLSGRATTRPDDALCDPDSDVLHDRDGALSLALERLAIEAPQTGKVWRIGVLPNLYPPDADPPKAFGQGLRDLGYVEGRNLIIDWRYQLDRDRLPTLATELV